MPSHRCYGRESIAGRHDRSNRQIYDVKVLRTANPSSRIYDRIVVIAHPTSSARMIGGSPHFAICGEYIIVALHIWPGPSFARYDARNVIGCHEIPNEADCAYHSATITLGCKIIKMGLWIDIRVPAYNMGATG